MTNDTARKVERPEPVNTNDLRDYADRIGNPYSQFILDAADNLDDVRTERNILQAELDAARAELAEVKEAAGEHLKNAFEHGTKAKGYAQKGDAASAGYHATQALYDISRAQSRLAAALKDRPTPPPEPHQ